MDNVAVELIARPKGIPGPEHFRTVARPMPTCPPGGLLVQSLYLSVEPAMRGWVSDENNYSPPVPIGSVMRAVGVGRVLESQAPDWEPGDVIYARLGWQAYAAIMPSDVRWAVDEAAAPLPAWLSVLGGNGIAAFAGFHACDGKAGETLLVSTAAGGVGSIACQLGRRAGMTVIGLTGSEAKRRLCLEEFGCSAAIDYKAEPDLAAAIAAAAPDGVDAFFDNTGGAIADAVFPQMRVYGRIAQCGTASVPSWTPWPDGPRRERLMLVKRLRWTGFLTTDDIELNRTARAELLKLVQQGALRHHETIIDGLENAPEALASLYRGDNTGKICIRP